MTEGSGPAGSSPLEESGLFRLAWAFYLLLALVGVLWVGAREGAIPLGLFFGYSTLARDLGLGVGVAGLLLLIWELTDRFVPLAKALEERLRSMLGSLDRGEAVGLALLSGFSEEFFFRGAVQGSWGWPVAAVLFAASHAGNDRSMWLWTAFAAVSGVVFGLLTVWTGNLLSAMLAHTLFNLVNLYRLSSEQAAGGTGE